ncbi:choline kinase [Coniella lustricola]|uniref:Choline kinase n=1 Tax=Coniella lustricola TaxID=2025994 RepID=A0A2T3AEG6_9PEZI|nr:choline kinase [Coniella lustricola]
MLAAVQISEPELEPLPHDETPFKRQYSASVSGKRLSGRPAMPTTSSSRSSLLASAGNDIPDALKQQSGNSAVPAQADVQAQGDDGNQQPQSPGHRHSHRVDRVSEHLLSQISDWLQHEKAKRDARKPRRHHHLRRRHHRSQPVEETIPEQPEPDVEISLERTTSADSNSSEVSFDRLQRILENSMAALGLNSIPQPGTKLGRRLSHRSKKYASRSSLHLSRAASSDTDYVDGDALVPSCDAILDNTQTLKYSQGGADDAVSICSRREEKEKQVWITFKNEIIRLAHTLRLKGWRRVPLDFGDDIAVERLSGALTNAVYVVTPPQELPESTQHITKKQPPKLLLRIYGPNVEHLIDRENELMILKRLARKKIGPRLLGTFTNGRFEQYFNAEPLTPEALREPGTSKQIAKRMRELHDGVDLLEEERDEGPTVFKNWDNWVENVEKRSIFLDQQVSTLQTEPSTESLESREYVCGTEWALFKSMVDKYRDFLTNSYGGPLEIRKKLVFAHNDTQYGNILRVRPDDERSPLLQPENEHKQLIVIDFEYASANLPGLEFANHFTEWAYNYHDATAPFACNVDQSYPTLEEQQRFVKAYINHRPKPVTSSSSVSDEVTPCGTPLLDAQQTPTPSSSSIVEFMLDARVPPGGWKEEERRATEMLDTQIKELLGETRLWRAMNSAQWVAWGIVQAKIPGYTDLSENAGENGSAPPSPVGSEATIVGESGNTAAAAAAVEEEGFDYLAYAHDRALFFWGDCVQLGLIKLEELPESLRKRVKLLDY